MSKKAFKSDVVLIQNITHYQWAYETCESKAYLEIYDQTE